LDHKALEGTPITAGDDVRPKGRAGRQRGFGRFGISGRAPVRSGQAAPAAQQVPDRVDRDGD